MLIRSLPKEERPMERALRSGIRTLSTAELIALLIRTGRQDQSSISVAEDILGLCDEGLYSLGSISPDELRKIRGIGESKACTIMAAIELGKRISMSRASGKSNITDPDIVAEMFMEDLRYEKKEFFKSVSVNAKGDVISVEAVSIGELARTLVHPREVFCHAIKKNAYGVFFIHNHPSGDSTPSDEDIATTNRLIECGELLGIKVMDHIIIGDGTYASMRTLGLMK